MHKLLFCAALLAACGPLTAEDLAALAAASASGSAAAPAADSELALLPSGELRASYDFTIEGGHHRSNHDFVARPHLGKRVDRELRFRAVFSPDAAYATQAPSNQSDWNKLMGLSTDRIHKNSIRIGWRWNPASQRIELGYYGYLDGVRTMQLLADVAPGQPIDCVLRMTNAGMSAQAGAASHSVSGSLGVGFPTTWVLHSAYFGGDEKAPHRIDVQVSDVWAQ